MKQRLPWIVCGLFALWVLSALRPAPKPGGFALAEFGRLPVLLNGRVQPFDSVARNTLLSMHGTQTVRPAPGEASGRVLSATEWLLELMSKPEQAGNRQVFRVESLELRNLLDAREGRLGQLAYNDFSQQKLQDLEQEARRISEKDSQLRSGYEKDALHLAESVHLYHRLRNSLRPENSQHFLEHLPDHPLKASLTASESGEFAGELKLYKQLVPVAMTLLHKEAAGEEYNQADVQLLASFFRRYEPLSRFAYPLIVPPMHPDVSRDDWSNIGTSLSESLRSGEVNPALDYFARMDSSFRKGRSDDFNAAVAEYRQWLQDKNLTPELKKGQREWLFNHLEPFYKSMTLYVAALILGCVFWLNFSHPVRRTAFYLVVLAFAIHTAGVLFRMFLEGRPPVTNLYSSAVFVGWGAVVLGIILERLFKDGVGVVTASTIGFVTLIIAHHLSATGDTMEMMRAVLDTNLWLATHVVVITIGYSATFLAGFLAIVYILRGVLSKGLTAETGKSLSRMVYGILCFATLFSFVGTVLGGIWADQSWGRFWGWDPKENGALLIVLMNAAILHARWGGIVRDRGLMVMAIAGNIVTAWSWFGVNMLGVGLHSYGFMDKAFVWLLTFIISQLVVMGLGMLPPRFWMSFKGNRPVDSTPKLSHRGGIKPRTA